MYRSILQVAILVLLSVCAQAQTLRFTVLEKESRQPVGLAFINVYSATNALLSTYQTDEMGVAEVAPQSYPCKIEIIMQGYDPIIKEFTSAPLNTSQAIQLTKVYSALNEVVVTGVSQPVKLKNALAAYQVIPAAVMQAQGAVTLNEALRTQLNMSIGNDNILGSNIRMQGVGGDKVKILIDGMPVNGREGGNINLSQINLNNVERVEIIQGPMSVMYGTDALGGVINVITRTESKKIGLRASGYYESVGKYNGNTSVTYKLKDVHQFTLGGGRNYFGGYQNIDAPIAFRDDTITTSRCYYFKPVEQYLGNFAYNYKPSSQFRLSFASDFLKEKITNKGSLQAWDPFVGAYAFDEYYYTTRSLNRLMLQGKIGKSGVWQSQNSYALYYRVRNREKKDLVTMEGTPTQGLGDQDTTRFENITLRGTYANKVGLLNYTVGYDVNMEFAHSMKVAGLNKKISDYALFTNVSYALIKDKLTAQGGMRGSYNTTYQSPIIPSMHMLYTPVKNLQIRGSYSRGFRAPALKEMYLSFIDQNHYLIGNPDIKAEKSNHVQLSASYQAYEEQKDYLQFIVTGYYNEIIDGIVLVPIHPQDPNSIEYTYNNFAHQSNAIGNAQVDGQWRNFHAQAGFSYAYNFKETGSYNAFAATEVNAMLQYAWFKPKVNFNIFYKMTGPQPFLMSNIDGGVTYSGRQNAIHTCDGSIEKKFFDNKLHLVAGVKNIFNIRTRQVSGVSFNGGAHGTGTVGLFLPRSIYTSLNLRID